MPDVGVARACRVMNIDRSLVYRHRAAARHLVAQPAPPIARPRPPLALSELERWCVLDALNSERFANCSARQTYATLLDEGVYLGSVRTMYRLLAGADQVRERRRQLTHPCYTRPELLAVQPNEVWSWDITKLRGPGKWTYFHLYVILDIFSRYVVGWMIAPRETAELAEMLIADTVAGQNIEPGCLTLHADRGTSMRSKSVAALLVDLEVIKTHSRLMFPMTTRSPNRTSRRLNIVLTSRIASAASRTPGRTARHSLPGTTPSIVIQGSRS
ncbi:Mobile element protein [Caballeronia sordidicola]|uniref:Mobile element protein n=1 Tax=Caballeronia sordidicola TaxID=196367 RepID=A0A242MYL6_CABSO|nr:Mobile element protein [Caballeronia sordidicola]